MCVYVNRYVYVFCFVLCVYIHIYTCMYVHTYTPVAQLNLHFSPHTCGMISVGHPWGKAALEGRIFCQSTDHLFGTTAAMVKLDLLCSHSIKHVWEFNPGSFMQLWDHSRPLQLPWETGPEKFSWVAFVRTSLGIKSLRIGMMNVWVHVWGVKGINFSVVPGRCMEADGLCVLEKMIIDRSRSSLGRPLVSDSLRGQFTRLFAWGVY